MRAKTFSYQDEQKMKNSNNRKIFINEWREKEKEKKENEKQNEMRNGGILKFIQF